VRGTWLWGESEGSTRSPHSTGQEANGLADSRHRHDLCVRAGVTRWDLIGLGRMRGHASRAPHCAGRQQGTREVHVFIALNTEIYVFCIEGPIVCPYKCIYLHLLVIVEMQYNMLSSQGSGPYVTKEHTFSRLSRYLSSCILLL